MHLLYSESSISLTGMIVPGCMMDVLIVSMMEHADLPPSAHGDKQGNYYDLLRWISVMVDWVTGLYS